MNQDPNGTMEDYEYFSRPEFLQDLRFSLAQLINQDRYGLEELIHSLDDQIFQDSKQNSSSCGLSCQCSYKLRQLSISITQEMRQRSANLSSVAHLSIKMIDFITDESTRHSHELQDYQGQVDRLQNAIDEATSKNTLIENDVMVFREQLEAAREELEEITEEREEEAVQVHEELQIMRDVRIQSLQRELEKMKSQLTYYKASVMSKSSLNGNDHDLLCKDTPHTSSLGMISQKDLHKLRLTNKIDDEEDMMIKFSSQKKKLQEENQRLKIEIDGLKKSTVQFINHKDESISILPTTITQGLTTKPSRSLLRVKTSSKSIYHADQSSPSNKFSFDFNEFLNLFKNKRQERLNKMTQQYCQDKSQYFIRHESQLDLQSQVNQPHQLYTQQSRSTLAINNAQPLQSQLIYLTQQSEDISTLQKEKYDYFFTNTQTNIQNKQTESSLKDSSTHNLMRMSIMSSKSYSSVGINTHQQSSQTAPNTEKKQQNELFGSRIMKKIAGSSLVNSLTNFVVNNRVKRKSKIANSGTCKILI